MMAARKDGRWGNTQENALRDGGARRLLPQVRERRRRTSARSSSSATEDLAREEFKGRIDDVEDARTCR